MESVEAKVSRVSRKHGVDSSEGENHGDAAKTDPGHAVAVEVIPAGAAIDLPESVEAFSDQIRARVQSQCHRFVEDCIAIGEAFLTAEHKYGKSLSELAEKAKLTYNTICQYVKVAKRFGPADNSWARAQLPASADSLARLSRLEPAQFKDAINKGKIKPDMGRKEVKSVLHEYRPATPKSSLKARSGKEATPPPAATLGEVGKRLTAFQTAVEECQERRPNSRDALLDLLTEHGNWIKIVLAKLGRKATG